MSYTRIMCTCLPLQCSPHTNFKANMMRGWDLGGANDYIKAFVLAPFHINDLSVANTCWVDLN